MVRNSKEEAMDVDEEEGYVGSDMNAG